MKGLSKVYKRSEIFPEPEWEALVEKLFNHKGTIFLMGVTSSGKSTLARYLIEKLLSKDTRIRYRRERFNVALGDIGDINVYD
jgi:polynucleotide 5'-kinase involved in rRNA processing